MTRTLRSTGNRRVAGQRADLYTVPSSETESSETTWTESNSNDESALGSRQKNSRIFSGKGPLQVFKQPSLKVTGHIGNAARDLRPAKQVLTRPELATALQRTFGHGRGKQQNKQTRPAAPAAPAVQVFPVPKTPAPPPATSRRSSHAHDSKSHRRHSHDHRSDDHRHGSSWRPSSRHRPHPHRRRRRSFVYKVARGLWQFAWDENLHLLALAVLLPALYASFVHIRAKITESSGVLGNNANANADADATDSSSEQVVWRSSVYNLSSFEYKAEIHPIIDSIHGLYRSLPRVAQSVPLTVGDVTNFNFPGSGGVGKQKPEDKGDSSGVMTAKASLEHFFEDLDLLLSIARSQGGMTDLDELFSSSAFLPKTGTAPQQLMESWRTVSQSITTLLDQSAGAEFLSVHAHGRDHGHDEYSWSPPPDETADDVDRFEGEKKKDDHQKPSSNSKSRSWSWFTSQSGKNNPPKDEKTGTATAATGEEVFLPVLSKAFGDGQPGSPGLRAAVASVETEMLHFLEPLRWVTDIATRIDIRVCPKDMRPNWDWHGAFLADNADFDVNDVDDDDDDDDDATGRKQRQNATLIRCALKSRAKTLESLSHALRQLDQALSAITRDYLDPIAHWVKKLQETPMPKNVVTLVDTELWNQCTEKDLPMLLPFAKVPDKQHPRFDGAWVVPTSKNQDGDYDDDDDDDDDMDDSEKNKKQDKASVFFFPPEPCMRRLFARIKIEYSIIALDSFRERQSAARSEYRNWHDSYSFRVVSERITWLYAAQIREQQLQDQKERIPKWVLGEGDRPPREKIEREKEWERYDKENSPRDLKEDEEEEEEDGEEDYEKFREKEHIRLQKQRQQMEDEELKRQMEEEEWQRQKEEKEKQRQNEYDEMSRKIREEELKNLGDEELEKRSRERIMRTQQQKQEFNEWQELSEAERREAEKREAEIREAEKREAEKREAERREAQRREIARLEAEMRELEKRGADILQARRRELDKLYAGMAEEEIKRFEMRNEEPKMEAKESDEKSTEGPVTVISATTVEAYVP